MSGSLQKKAFWGMIWSFAENFSLQGIQFVIGIIMARMLTPSDYGMIGMLTVFLAISDNLVNFGFFTALVRKSDRTEVDFSTVFYFNIFVGLFLYFVLFFSSPYIARFFEMPLLEDLTKIVAIPLFFNSICQVQQAKFSIKMDFKSQAKVSVTSSLVGGISGIMMAYYGLGVWSLAYSAVLSAIIRCLLLWILARWYPLRSFSWKSFNELFSFGSKLLVSKLIDTIYNNIYPIVIGKKFAAADLGFYSRAYGYSQLPAVTVTGVLARVTFPMLCEIQNDSERLEQVYRKLLRLSAFVVFPVMIGLAVLAKPLIIFMITDKWAPSIILLQIFCLALMWYPIHAINLNLLQVKGRSDLVLRLEIIKKIMGILVLILSIPLGVIYMCVGQVITSLVSLLINTHYTGKLIRVGFFKQMSDMLPTLLYSFSMGGIVWGVSQFLPTNGLKIIVGILVGAIYYVAIAYYTRSSELYYMFSLIKNKK